MIHGPGRVGVLLILAHWSTQYAEPLSTACIVFSGLYAQPALATMLLTANYFTKNHDNDAVASTGKALAVQETIKGVMPAMSACSSLCAVAALGVSLTNVKTPPETINQVKKEEPKKHLNKPAENKSKKRWFGSSRS
jgi:hypothetical protein